MLMKRDWWLVARYYQTIILHTPADSAVFLPASVLAPGVQVVKSRSPAAPNVLQTVVQKSRRGAPGLRRFVRIVTALTRLIRIRDN